MVGTMRLVHSPAYEVDFGPHVFPTAKFRLVRELLLDRGVARPDDLVEPERPTSAQLELVHTAEYLDDLESLRWCDRTSHSELPLTREIVDAYVLASGGTLAAAREAVARRTLAGHLGGGFHHAFAGHAEGFCYINDIAVAIRVLQREERIGRALVADLDLHQGNGTAHIFRDDASVFTFSMHQEANYPAKQQSDLDIGLDDGAGDTEYLAALRRVWPGMLDRHKPDLVIYVAGADPYEDDQLGALKLTMDGLRTRDELILTALHGRGIPGAVVLAGGYARHLDDLVKIHMRTLETAATLARSR